jgi:Zn-finger nucleic acid-binding protein
MRCPACDGTLEEVRVGDMAAHVCSQGCGGIWLDRGELARVDEEHEDADVLLSLRADPSVAVDHELRRNCPRCPDIMMMRRFTSVRREVAIDECTGCGGIWLDAGELDAIRAEADIRRRHREQVDEAFGSMPVGPVPRRRSVPLGHLTESALLSVGDLFGSLRLDF